MKWLQLTLAFAIAAGCSATQPAATNELTVSPEDQLEAEQELDELRWPQLGDHISPTVSLDFPDHREDTWGAPARPRAFATLGERLGQDPRDDLWDWTECDRFYAKATLGGPTGIGQVVRTDSRSRYRLWSLNPLTVEVEIHGFVGEPANEFEFIDQRGRAFVPTDDADLQAPVLQGVETLHCDGRTRRSESQNWVESSAGVEAQIRRDYGKDWLRCSELSVLTADRVLLSSQPDDSSSLRILNGDAVEWVTRGATRRATLAAQVLSVQCAGKQIRGVRPARSSKPRKDCAERTYHPNSRSWKRLPAANVVATSDDCVGYCFEAFVDSVTAKKPRLVRVAIIEENGSLGRATLRRSSRSEGSYRGIDEGLPLRFACAEKSAVNGAVPHFDDCAQMFAEPADDWACLTQPSWSSQRQSGARR